MRASIITTRGLVHLVADGLSNEDLVVDVQAEKVAIVVSSTNHL